MYDLTNGQIEKNPKGSKPYCMELSVFNENVQKRIQLHLAALTSEDFSKWMAGLEVFVILRMHEPWPECYEKWQEAQSYNCEACVGILFTRRRLHGVLFSMNCIHCQQGIARGVEEIIK